MLLTLDALGLNPYLHPEYSESDVLNALHRLNRLEIVQISPFGDLNPRIPSILECSRPW